VKYLDTGFTQHDRDIGTIKVPVLATVAYLYEAMIVMIRVEYVVIVEEGSRRLELKHVRDYI
jgi:hypothetical protein